MSQIAVSSVAKQYDEMEVLTNVSFEVAAGEVYGLLGPNGAGKTTTIDVLTGVERQDSGDVSVLGVDPSTDSVRVRELVGILPEKESPPSFLTPREYFSFIAGIRELDVDAVMDDVTAWAERLAFTEKLDVLNKDLSRGQQQKVMLTQALIHEPEVVFIDEPLANLDPLMQERVEKFIAAYHEAGNTIVLSTHHLSVAEALCTRVGILHGGEIRAEHTPGTDSRALLAVFEETVHGETDD